MDPLSRLNYCCITFLVHPCDRKEKACSQICNKKGDEYHCSCEEDFKLDSDNKTCTESKHSIRTALILGFSTAESCSFWFPIYVSFLIFSHLLEHPCDKEDNGGCQQICTENGKDYKCSCKEGFKLNTDMTSCTKGMLLTTSIALIVTS